MNKKIVVYSKPRKSEKEIEKSRKYIREKLIQIFSYLQCYAFKLIEEKKNLLDLWKEISDKPNQLYKVLNADRLIDSNVKQLYELLYDEEFNHLKFGINMNKLWKIVKEQFLGELAHFNKEKDSNDNEESEEDISNIKWIKNTEQWLNDTVEDGIFNY